MKKPFLYASLAALYIIAIVFVVSTLSSALKMENGTIVIPMTMLSLFVLSAAVMGFLFLSEPLYLLMENRKQEAIVFFGKIVGIFACFVVIFTGLLFLNNSFQNAPLVGGKNGKLVTGSDIETFSGTITAVNTGCFSDAICSVTVDGKKIILVQGGRGQSPDIKVGKLLGVDSIGDLEQKIGQHANVYATTTPDGGYTLYGNSNYYVEVVNLKN